MEPTPLKLLVGVVFASILIGVFIGLQGGQGTQFPQKAEDLSGVIKSLGDVGSKKYFSITVPENSQLRFEGENVVAVIGNTRWEYNCDMSVEEGDNSLGPGSYSLTLKRVEGGVEVSV